MNTFQEPYVPTWRAEPLSERLRRACDLLHQYGLLTEGQHRSLLGQIAEKTQSEPSSESPP